MANIEAAAARAPLPPLVLPPPTRRRATAVEMKVGVADAIIYCFVGAIFVASAASITVVAARYAAGRSSTYAYAVVAVARDVFLQEFLTVVLLCPFTILLLALHIDRRQPEPPEELVLIGGVYATVQLHGREHPGARGRRQGAGYVLVPLLIFVVFSMCMLLGLLLQERWPAKRSCVQTVGNAAFISDIGSFACSLMVIFGFSPYMLVQLRSMPR